MKLIPELPRWALDALQPPAEFAETDQADMGTAFGLDASLNPLPALTPEETAARDALAQDPLQRRLERRSL